MQAFFSVGGAVKALRAHPDATCIKVESSVDGVHETVYVVGYMCSFDQIERCELTADGAGLTIAGHITVSRLNGNLNTTNPAKEG